MSARFQKESWRGVAQMLALMAIPLMGAVGVAVDYTRASATRTAFQAALDSTAPMLSKTAATQTAGDESNFFLLTSSTQIVTTFNQIGTALFNLRLSM